MLEHSCELVEVMSQKSPAELSALMSISPQLAELNHERYRDFDVPFTPQNARPAVLAFNGDVYVGLKPQMFSERDFTHAQKTLRILSGLYGVLRPLDLMQPYRLEMGSRVATTRGENLYHYWGNSITDLLNSDAAVSPGAKALVNLASNEYFSAVNSERLSVRLVTPVFLDASNGSEPKIVSFYAKRARGLMASWIIRNRVRSIRALAEFDSDGYSFDPSRSEVNRPVFVRSHLAP